jgi:hypothetical protein|tara:strand:+ start:2230 stop:2400 length:171 start_codon:yes stop_codon:yes gene_type:complete
MNDNVKKLFKVDKMKAPKIIIWDEATETILVNPTKYDIHKAFIKNQNILSKGKLEI